MAIVNFIGEVINIDTFTSLHIHTIINDTVLIKEVNFVVVEIYQVEVNYMEINQYFSYFALGWKK